MIALSNDNQWTVELCLPDNTHHYFLFSSKRSVLNRSWQKEIFSAKSNSNICGKMLTIKNI